jgi:hypothetical protein
MAEQLAGAGVGLVLVLGYLLLVQVMAAAVLLLAQFTLLQWRSLKTLLSQEPPRPLPVPAAAREVHESRGEPTRRVVVGGGIRRWE